ncbi:MAG: hypothetical protein ACJ763_14230 [Bdellovibrionia bacterium]
MRRRFHLLTTLAIALSALNITAPTQAIAQDTQTAVASTSKALADSIGSRVTRVPEFQFIREEAKRLGVRAYLFGGTAAGFAHYVNWDLKREGGDTRYHPDRFNYDYTEIYHSTQDLDIVIDGPPRKAKELQDKLSETFSHLQGNKSAWEVRLLRQDMGDKQALLNNPDFLNQHTDSNSTGMIEISEPHAGDPVVRDLRDWDSKDPYFLRDVREGKLHYYFSPLHSQTKFAKEGRNPPILSVIRFLTKAFQYELEIRPEDFAQIKKVIQEFDSRRDTQNPYVARWIEKNGKKLIQNAVNIEYARNTLDQLGLREKLQSVKGDVRATDSLAWWLNKEPLRTLPLGQGTGKTARELGLEIVAHETNNFLAYESITRALTGDPNVLVSRSGAAGELAVHGDGFYAKTGKEGARGTGLTIRFRLDPNAREGHDFIYVPHENFIVVKNKAALKVIPESLNVSLIEYFQMIESGKAGDLTNDRGTVEKLKRRITARSKSISHDEINEVLKIVQSEIEKSGRLENSAILREWLSLPLSADHPDIFHAVLNKASDQTDKWLVTEILTKPYFKDGPEWVERILDRETSDKEIARHILSLPNWKDHPEWIERLIERGTADDELFFYVLTQPHWREHPELLRLTGGQTPTMNNLIDAFARGETLRTASKACVLEHLNKSLP